MERLELAATDRSPAVSFDFDRHRLKIGGESYPEDVSAFYHPIFEALDAYLARLGNGGCRFDFELIYINSSSAKAIMMLMEKLDEAAKNGASIEVHWHYDQKDDTMQELGEELGEDLQHVAFHLEKMAT